MRRIMGLAVCAAMAVPGAAAAQAVGGKEARKALFDLRGRSVETAPLPGLDDDLQDLLRQALQASAADVRYYGAVAMAPGAALDAEATALAENFHDSESAQAAALENCNARRPSTSEPCVIVALTLPRNYEPRPVELSVDATEAYRKEYRRAKAPKSLAISPATGRWSIAVGPGAAEAAVEACNRQAAAAGAQDCRAAIVD